MFKSARLASELVSVSSTNVEKTRNDLPDSLETAISCERYRKVQVQALLRQHHAALGLLCKSSLGTQSKIALS